MKAKIIVALLILTAISFNTAAEAFPFGGNYGGNGGYFRNVGNYGGYGQCRHHRHHRHCGRRW